ncbi:hypothetical protein [Bradyrhizobium sp. USDA 10063]
MTDTITVDIEALRASERLRIVKATEWQAKLIERSLAAQLRLAEAAERQALALENITLLFESCIGRGVSSCPPSDSMGQWGISDVLYLRTGDGTKSFGCDKLSASDDDGG